jgi:hypothetical protein
VRADFLHLRARTLSLYKPFTVRLDKKRLYLLLLHCEARVGGGVGREDEDGTACRRLKLALPHVPLQSRILTKGMAYHPLSTILASIFLCLSPPNPVRGAQEASNAHPNTNDTYKKR